MSTALSKAIKKKSSSTTKATPGVTTQSASIKKGANRSHSSATTKYEGASGGGSGSRARSKLQFKANSEEPTLSRGQRAMFQCGECDQSEFDLMVRTDPTTTVAISTNQHDEIVIQVGQRPPFVADIAFMNRFASCRHCGASKMWRYWFPAHSSGPVSG